MTDTQNLPDLPPVTEADLRASGLPALMEMSPGLALFFNDALYKRCKSLAMDMSLAGSMMPAHLAGKPAACFAVISNAVTWKLNPYNVARATYMTPGGSIGYLGSLVQAIIEASGAIEGGVRYEHYGDWTRLQGKYKVVQGQSGKGSYPVAEWTNADAIGLGVIVSAKMKNEVEPRTLKFDLVSAFPRNSPLWATDPGRQICYTAVRAFGNLTVPLLMYGIPFDVEPDGLGMHDITPPKTATPPRPARSAFERPSEPSQEPDPADPVPDVAQDVAASQDAPEAAQQAQEPEPVDEQKPAQAKEVEDPVERGRRLLQLMKGPNDVADLRATIGEELADDPPGLAMWNKDCDARSAELTGGDKAAKPKGRK